MCRPALAAATLATIGRFAAVKPAIAAGPSSAFRSMAVSHARHKAASVTTAAAKTTASCVLHGRWAAALIRRATDSPSTIRTKIWNLSARCSGFSGTRRLGDSIPRAPTASVSRAAPQKAYRAGVSTASDDSHRTPPSPKKIRYHE
jgi:hypothetical protein